MICFSREKALDSLRITDLGVTVDDIENVEKELGFELTPQQIYYIATGTWRRTGRTTAEAIRRYFEAEKEGRIITITKASNARRDFENNEFVRIAEKLNNKGIRKVEIIYGKQKYSNRDLGGAAGANSMRQVQL